ncbi:MAG: carbohydrate kinase family protein [Planctomycetota bacterium]|jgi:sugar/nucleoside kinase (ribokinase family)
MIPRPDRDIDLLGFGVAAVDELIEIAAQPPVDVKVDVNGHATQCGGICVNALVAAARLGLRCHYAGPLGENHLSRIVREGMDDAGITYAAPVACPDTGPSHAFILVDRSAGTRTIFMNKARVREMAPGEPAESLIARSRALYVDAWRLDAGLPAVQAARRLGVEVIADFEEYEPDRVRPLLPYVDHLILPRSYAQLLTGAERVEEMLHSLARQSRRCTSVTVGDAGSWFMTDDEPGVVHHQPAYEANVVDTTGCGDAFHGAYMAGVLGGMTVGESMRFAAAAAALSATALGAQAGLPTRSEVEALLSRETAGARV